VSDTREDVLAMRVDDLREVLDDTFACVGCTETSCRDCEVSRNRREALGDD
jgi:hypothetical protein